ncbi:hypothetical protein AB835_14045 [Candidatus Endobugula sertula]|uniref:Uncharacterized protein n=1 Tax=Candidatus Endobugula sertula TaxID=62101 RepID=A0A1D2QLK8_9GAMM|nr:hypothetical protein AB835_14045 [Candidatus Endobugula sertula]
MATTSIHGRKTQLKPLPQLPLLHSLVKVITLYGIFNVYSEASPIDDLAGSIYFKSFALTTDFFNTEKIPLANYGLLQFSINSTVLLYPVTKGSLPTSTAGQSLSATIVSNIPQADITNFVAIPPYTLARETFSSHLTEPGLTIGTIISRIINAFNQTFETQGHPYNSPSVITLLNYIDSHTTDSYLEISSNRMRNTAIIRTIFAYLMDKIQSYQQSGASALNLELGANHLRPMIDLYMAFLIQTAVVDPLYDNLIPHTSFMAPARIQVLIFNIMSSSRLTLQTSVQGMTSRERVFLDQPLDIPGRRRHRPPEEPLPYTEYGHYLMKLIGCPLETYADPLFKWMDSLAATQELGYSGYAYFASTASGHQLSREEYLLYRYSRLLFVSVYSNLSDWSRTEIETLTRLNNHISEEIEFQEASRAHLFQTNIEAIIRRITVARSRSRFLTNCYNMFRALTIYANNVLSYVEKHPSRASYFISQDEINEIIKELEEVIDWLEKQYPCWIKLITEKK